LGPEPDSSAVQKDTIFPLASLTKPIIATIAMILVEEGHLGLNRPVSFYIPEFTGEGKDMVIVHHLLTHTSGLRDEDVFTKDDITIQSSSVNATEHPYINDLLHLGYNSPLHNIPGGEMSYCNYGYVLLGEIIQRVSGKPLSVFAKEKLFGPLGMKDTHYIMPNESVWDRMVKRSWDSPCSFLQCRRFRKIPFAAGSILSTAMDIAIFGQMFLNYGCYENIRILSPASVFAMTHNQIPGVRACYRDEFFKEAFWGLGWNIHGDKKDRGTLQSSETFSHGGAGEVFLWVDPIYEIIGVYLSVMLQNGISCVDLFMNMVTAAVVDV